MKLLVKIFIIFVIFFSGKTDSKGKPFDVVLFGDSHKISGLAKINLWIEKYLSKSLNIKKIGFSDTLPPTNVFFYSHTLSHFFKGSFQVSKKCISACRLYPSCSGPCTEPFSV